MPSRFDYVQYDTVAIEKQNKIKEKVQELEALANDFTAPTAGRAKSLVLTKLEEVYMWFGKAIRDEQIARNGSAPLQEERKNG